MTNLDEATTPDEPATKKPNSVLRIALVTILGLMAIALTVDCNARWSCDAAFETLSKKLTAIESTNDLTSSLSPDDVAKILGREPVDEIAPVDEKTSRFFTAEYQWRGIPGKTYAVHVTYSQVLEDKRFFAFDAARNQAVPQ